MPIIMTSSGVSTLVDEEDMDLAQRRWHVIYPGRGVPYVRGYVSKNPPKNESLHRVIVARMVGRELTRKDTVDHINCDTLDNRRANLRLVTRAQNAWNRRRASNNTSGYKGVCFINRTGKWRAYIDYKGRKHNLGEYGTPEEAHEVYKREATRLYGEFARFE